MRFVAPALLLLIGSGSVTQAQVTIQQPVVGTAGVSTTVSVPDRGTTFLGGVSSAASSRTTYGPLRTGTTRTSSLSASSMSASVYIIDLQAMDEAILNSVPDAPASMTIRNRSVTSEHEVAHSDLKATADKIAKFERLAQQAESAGKHGVAKLHWQMAARHGSTLAHARLKPVSGTIAEATARN